MNFNLSPIYKLVTTEPLVISDNRIGPEFSRKSEVIITTKKSGRLKLEVFGCHDFRTNDKKPISHKMKALALIFDQTIVS